MSDLFDWWWGFEIFLIKKEPRGKVELWNGSCNAHLTRYILIKKGYLYVKIAKPTQDE